MLMTRLENEPEEEEPKTTEPRRRLELGNAEPEEPKTAGRTARRSTRNHQQKQGSPKRKAQGAEPHGKVAVADDDGARGM